MKKLIRFVIVIIPIVLLSKQEAIGQLQYIKQLDSVEQSCLDKGTDMSGCTITYYNQMDSMLNVSYKSLREKLDNNSKTALKKEQHRWLLKRDKKFKAIDKDTSNGDVRGADAEMIATDKKAAIIKERVITLIQRANIK
jgi:uncharacterized protein YecT (DUF1311 family)